MNKRLQMQLVAKIVRYLSNGRTSEAAVGSPLEFGDSFLFGGTDGTPERGHVLTTATSVGLHEAQHRDKDNGRVISKNGRDIRYHNVERGEDSPGIDTQRPKS